MRHAVSFYPVVEGTVHGKHNVLSCFASDYFYGSIPAAAPYIQISKRSDNFENFIYIYRVDHDLKLCCKNDN
jgi:hypothetical protein